MYPQERLVPYDSSWATRYREYEAHLQAHLGREFEVEHVGSTSVPGLLAKPVIDIALRMPEGVSLCEVTQHLSEAGWSQPVQVGDHWATVFEPSGVRASIGHLFTAVQWPEAHVRLFADWLRRHDDDRDQYALLKQDIVWRGVWGHAYTDAKSAFVRSTVNRARADRGLPAVEHAL
jgi:GrpB-like predicted nucleotidyltransferase (UPF0157 family)